MLSDVRRNRAFHRALERHVRDSSCVLDIGSGTGLWAIMAAHLGARRVVAVERNSILLGLIKHLAHANGVAKQVEVVHGDSRQLTLEREFDLIVSETIGNIGFEEEIVSIVLDARNRFLKPDGAVIPQAITLMAAPAIVQTSKRRLPAGLSLNYEQFEPLALNSPLELLRRVRYQLVAKPHSLIRTDLAHVAALPDLTNLSACWHTVPVRAINGFAVWVNAALTDGVRLSTRKTTSWTPVFYRIEPFPHDVGDIEFKLSLTPESNYWSAASQGQTRAYSPAFAAAELTARARMEPEVFERMRSLGLLSRRLPSGEQDHG
jgi:precorrin-6B methylase 2